METPNARLAMTIAKGILSSGFILAAGFYGCSRMQDDNAPATTPKPPVAATPATAADECAVRAVDDKIIPTIENLTAEFRLAREHGLAVETEQAAARITDGAQFRISRCAQSTGTELSETIVAQQMHRVEQAKAQFIAEFK